MPCGLRGGGRHTWWTVASQLVGKTKQQACLFSPVSRVTAPYGVLMVGSFQVDSNCAVDYLWPRTFLDVVWAAICKCRESQVQDKA